MADYENEYSYFPQKTITLHNFKNVDDSTGALINQINTLRSQKAYEEAARLIRDNQDILSACSPDAATFNSWLEEIYNTQIYARQVQQSIFFSDEPVIGCKPDDVWIGG